MGTPFCCIQLSGVRLMGSKVLKNTSENSLCLRVFSTAPVGHSVHLKKSCGLAYQTSPAPVISKSRVTLNSSKGSSRKGYGATRHTRSCRKKIVRDIRQDIRSDIGYDITYKSQISGMISGMIFPKKKIHMNKKAQHVIWNRTPAYRLTRGCMYRSDTVAVNIMRKIIYIYSTCYDVLMKFQRLPKKDITSRNNTRKKLIF